MPNFDVVRAQLPCVLARHRLRALLDAVRGRAARRLRGIPRLAVADDLDLVDLLRRGRVEPDRDVWRHAAQARGEVALVDRREERLRREGSKEVVPVLCAHVCGAKKLGDVRDRVAERVVTEARVVVAGSAGDDQVVAVLVDRAVAAPAAHVEGAADERHARGAGRADGARDHLLKLVGRDLVALARRGREEGPCESVGGLE
jgi:hypothetical protein